LSSWFYLIPSHLWPVRFQRTKDCFVFAEGKMEKIGNKIFILWRCFATPNRRLLNKKVLFDFVKPFDLIPEFKAKINEIGERSPATGGASEPLNRLKKSRCLVWSGLLNTARTYFEQNPD